METSDIFRPDNTNNWIPHCRLPNVREFILSVVWFSWGDNWERYRSVRSEMFWRHVNWCSVWLWFSSRSDTCSGLVIQMALLKFFGSFPAFLAHPS